MIFTVAIHRRVAGSSLVVGSLERRRASRKRRLHTPSRRVRCALESPSRPNAIERGHQRRSGPNPNTNASRGRIDDNWAEDAQTSDSASRARIVLSSHHTLTHTLHSPRSQARFGMASPQSDMGLPTLLFDARLALVAWTPATRTAFPWIKLSTAVTVTDLVHFEGADLGEDDLASAQLSELASRCSTGRLGWGAQTCTLDIFTHTPIIAGPLPEAHGGTQHVRKQSCVAVVQRRDVSGAGGFAILLLHPSYPSPVPSPPPSPNPSETIDPRPILARARASGTSDVSTGRDEGAEGRERKRRRSLKEYLLDTGSRADMDRVRLQKMMDNMAQVPSS